MLKTYSAHWVFLLDSRILLRVIKRKLYPANLRYARLQNNSRKLGQAICHRDDFGNKT